MKTQATNKEQIIRSWESAYAEWESGRNASPSAEDLVAIAHDINTTLPNGEDIADAIYDAQNDGNDLSSVYDIVYGVGH